MAYVIGLDIGTTSVKAVLFDEKGNVAAEHERMYPLFHPYASWAEQDPIQIEQAAIAVLKEVLGTHPIPQEELSGIGMSTAMHTLICVAKDGTPLSNSITWADTRSRHEAETLKATRSDIYFQTGTPLHSMTPLSKLIWMKNTGSHAYHQADKYISIKEFIIKRWFHEEVVDYSVASASGLFDVKALDWNGDALALAGITKENLYTPVPPTYSLIGLSKGIAEEIGIHTKTPFVIGASDGPLANLGVGAVNKGDTVITIGTSGAIRQFTEKPTLNKKQEVFSYRFTESLWITGGASNNGAVVFSWLQKILQSEEHPLQADIMNTLAEKSPVGARKLLFLPYINGERAPVWDGKARGTFIGLHNTHQKEDMIRAAMEGVVFNIFQIAQVLDNFGNQPNQLYVNGGFSNSTLWVHILVDIFGQEVTLPISYQSSAWGAAWLALYSLGEVSSLEEIKQVIQMKETVQPDMENHKRYQEIYAVYKDIYTQLKGIYDQLDLI